ncbi:hypothetical protein [Bacillus horti]|uniref:GLUG domain-containing protein n=1 Tax=Caldalkalibacillus horti TaxID=77523 RepID=A0ABT9VVY2_9BACI|nr:hypothetical protein [Bacillus horti]MDQ0165158.1 hypothetical protein [Bacillus horti]
MADGNFAGGDGSVEYPFLIEDIYDLSAIRNNTSAHYKLIKDIDQEKFPLFNNFIPIPTFDGKLDGNGHWIYNFKTTGSGARGMIVSLLGNSMICNINFSNALSSSSASNSNLAIIVGEAFGNSILKNCYVYGVTSSTSTNNVSASSGYGLIAGVLSEYSSIKNCYAIGTVTYSRNNSSGGRRGGICGRAQNNATIENCYSRVIVNGSNAVGSGLVAVVSDDAQVINCFWDSSIESRTGTPGTGANQTTGTPLITEQLMESINFVEWDGDYQEPVGDEQPVKTWSIVNGYFPRLFHQIRNRMMMVEPRDNTEITDINFGYIVAGGQSAIREVTLRSKYLLDLEKIEVWWNRKPTISPYTRLRLSRTIEPFEELEVIQLSELELKFMEEVKFYVKVSTDEELDEGGAFDLNVRVTPK